MLQKARGLFGGASAGSGGMGRDAEEEEVEVGGQQQHLSAKLALKCQLV